VPLNFNQLPLHGTLTRKRSMVRIHSGLPFFYGVRPGDMGYRMYRSQG